jgi:MFS family permease
MLPLTVFRSRTFSVINILTLLLYAALGGALFFLPFALIQVRGYSATFAGAAFLPFTIIMAGLSRWAGGLLDRFGARLPLVTGPAISALGLGLMASMVAGGAYWEFLVAIVILGFGMVISVAHHGDELSIGKSDRDCLRDQQRGCIGGQSLCGCHPRCSCAWNSQPRT